MMTLASPRRPRSPRQDWTLRLLFLALLAPLSVAPVPAALQAQEVEITTPDDEPYILPADIIQDFFSRDPNIPRLEYVSPDGNHVAVALSTELSTLERMGETTYRLAELEIRPRTDRLWHLDTYGINALKIYDIAGRAWRDVPLPAGSFASDLTWSPDGGQLAFLAHLANGTEVWTAEAATGRARRVAEARVLATLATSAGGQGTRPSQMLQWTPRGTLITLLVPSDRGAEPVRPVVAEGPRVRRTREAPVPARTLPNLLGDPTDARLFAHFTRAQIAELIPGRRPRMVGTPGMVRSISISPDGAHLMVTRLEPPFSYLTSWNAFPTVTEVVEVESGRVLGTLDRTELREGGGGGSGGNGGSDWRSMTWRPDGAGISFLQRDPSEPGAGEGNGERGDRIMLLPPPFDSASARVVVSSPDPIRSVVYTLDGSMAVGTVTRGDRTGIQAWDLTQASPQPATVVAFRDNTRDPLEDPGSLWTLSTGNGLEHVLRSGGGDALYLRGPGYTADFRPRPWVDRVAIGSGNATRVFQGSSDLYEEPLVALDPELNRMIVSRESISQIPDSWLWSSGSWENLTNNRDPFPETTAARRVDFNFQRRDGLEVQGRISLPVGYRDGEKVPAVFWTYPREYTTNEEYQHAAIRSRNVNQFPRVTWLRWSDMWLTQGYALVYPDIPIIGENYNDTYISSMVDAMYGAMRAVDGLGFVDMDRVGHGGHSYGAFATMNIVAHTPFFRAGIAGHGAYNRSLTPSGFQAERRTIWEAPDTYIEMSPFFKADQINTPVLMYHGMDDNNTGTWPIQSERMMHALQALGKTAELYMYPYESHTPRALENNLDMWARWISFFDRYVKGSRSAAASEDGSGEAHDR
jgi:dipeptidyl aminopeptidase/acylaminoacyl peptidase